MWERWNVVWSQGKQKKLHKFSHSALFFPFSKKKRELRNKDVGRL